MNWYISFMNSTEQKYYLNKVDQSCKAMFIYNIIIYTRFILPQETALKGFTSTYKRLQQFKHGGVYLTVLICNQALI